MRLVEKHIPVLLVDSNFFSSTAIKILFDSVDGGFELEHNFSGTEVISDIAARLDKNESAFKLIIIDDYLPQG